MGLMIVFSFIYSLYILQGVYQEFTEQTEELTLDEEGQVAELEEVLTEDEINIAVRLALLVYGIVSIAWAGYIQFVAATPLARVLYHLELMLFIAAQLQSFWVPPRFWEDNDFIATAMWYANIALSIIYLLHCGDIMAGFLVAFYPW